MNGEEGQREEKRTTGFTSVTARQISVFATPPARRVEPKRDATRDVIVPLLSPPPPDLGTIRHSEFRKKKTKCMLWKSCYSYSQQRNECCKNTKKIQRWRRGEDSQTVHRILGCDNTCFVGGILETLLSARVHLHSIGGPSYLQCETWKSKKMKCARAISRLWWSGVCE